MHELGVKEQYIPLKTFLFEEPYSESIKILKSISNCLTPKSKIDVLIKVAKEINHSIDFNEMNKTSKTSTSKKFGDRGADDLFPVYLYIFIKSNITTVYSEYQFLNQFSDEEIHVKNFFF
jgi:hypothetical protein